MKINKDKFIYEFTRNQATHEEIHENILEGMNVHGANFIILICAIIIASVGLNMNATAVIIGAMLISPLMGSIIGIGYGVGTYNVNLIKEAFKILILSIGISIITSTFYFSITPITTAGSEILSRTSPTIWDVIIAFVGGIAGMVGITRNKSSNVIPGVAIATALMPPLCTAGYGLATKQPNIFLGAGYLFLINCFFITISTVIVTKALNLPTRINIDDKKQKHVKKIIIIASIIVIIPSMFSAFNMIKETIDENNLNTFISQQLSDQYIVSKNINEKNDTITLAVMGDRISDREIEKLQNSLTDYGFENKKLIIKQDESKINDLEKYINDIKNQSNAFITDNHISSKKEEVIETNAKNLDVSAISSELKVIYPKINDVYAGYINGEKDEDKDIPVLIVYTEDEDLNNQLTTIENWFKARVKAKEVKVYIQKMDPNKDVKIDDGEQIEQ
ncbi:MAG: TIGR00341 family protein [Romboutsia sp.]